MKVMLCTSYNTSKFFSNAFHYSEVSIASIRQKHTEKLGGAFGSGFCPHFAVNATIILSVQLCRNGGQKLLPIVSLTILFENVILVVHCEFWEFFLLV